MLQVKMRKTSIFVLKNNRNLLKNTSNYNSKKKKNKKPTILVDYSC